MTTATTAYRNYRSPGALPDPSFDNDEFQTTYEATSHSVRPRDIQQVRTKARPTTMFVRFVVALDADAVGDVTIIRGVQHEPLDLELFVSPQIKSTRRVRFHVKKRLEWTPNPLIASAEE